MRSSHHQSFVQNRCAFLALACIACGAEPDDSHSTIGTVKSAVTSDQEYYYLRCNATGWGADDATRMIATPSPGILSLTYEVTEPWMVSGGDSCQVTRTNEAGGWGTEQSFFGANDPAPLVVPQSAELTTGNAIFVRYPNTGSYTATLDIEDAVLAIAAAQTPCMEPISEEYAALCTACGGEISCNGTCSNQVPTDIGAACGGCGGVVRCDGSCSLGSTQPCVATPTANDRLDACSRDPRVLAGLVSVEICAGARVFIDETFEGNGRTCASCHPVANNFTIDPTFVSALHAENPNDPLFVHQNVSELAQLETDDLMAHGAILLNVDGFQDPTNRFVSRSVPHLFSLATTIDPDPQDTTTIPPAHRLGWGGDGTDDGSLNGFLAGAINQHFTKRLDRVPGVDFREPTELESNLVELFQLSLGRTNELDLEQVQLFDASADNGRVAFLDPARARCNVCHSNAGANFDLTGLNRNFDNGVRAGHLTHGTIDGIPVEEGGIVIEDAGFGGMDLDQPNVDVVGIGFANGFGNLTFSPPPLIEAADTGPFFHSNAVFLGSNGPTLEDVVQFYGVSAAFQFSSGAQELNQIFDGPAEMLPGDLVDVARMLRVLNAVFNLDIATQRLEAAVTLALRLRAIRPDLQTGLSSLAAEEIEDAIRVLSESSPGGTLNIHPDERAQLDAALNEIVLGQSATTWSGRQQHLENAIGFVNVARAGFGSGIAFVLGQGNLMF